MTIPSDPEIEKKLLSDTLYRGEGEFGGFSFSVDPSAPYIATAIHAGKNVRDELVPLMKINAKERFFEEDPETNTLIQAAESAVWGLDSRSEYDLNRPEKEALPLTPEKFWGMQVYRAPLKKEMIQLSLNKYHQFYTFMGSWAKSALRRFGVCVVYDIHSYNLGRQIQKGFSSPPFFNVGTRQLDRQRWKTAIEDWIDRLHGLAIPGIETTVAENCVFQGEGELCRKMTRWDEGILVLPTEIAKVYMDEKNGIVDQEKVTALRNHLGNAMADHSCAFLQQYGKP